MVQNLLGLPSDIKLHSNIEVP